MSHSLLSVRHLLPIPPLLGCYRAPVAWVPVIQQIPSGCLFYIWQCIVGVSCLIVPTLCDPVDCRLPGSLSMGCSRQEHWVGCRVLLQGMVLWFSTGTPLHTFLSLFLPLLSLFLFNIVLEAVARLSWAEKGDKWNPNWRERSRTCSVHRWHGLFG